MAAKIALVTTFSPHSKMLTHTLGDRELDADELTFEDWGYVRLLHLALRSNQVTVACVRDAIR